MSSTPPWAPSAWDTGHRAASAPVAPHRADPRAEAVWGLSDQATGDMGLKIRICPGVSKGLPHPVGVLRRVHETGKPGPEAAHRGTGHRAARRTGCSTWLTQPSRSSNRPAGGPGLRGWWGGAQGWVLGMRRRAEAKLPPISSMRAHPDPPQAGSGRSVDNPANGAHLGPVGEGSQCPRLGQRGRSQAAGRETGERPPPNSRGVRSELTGRVRGRAREEGGPGTCGRTARPRVRTRAQGSGLRGPPSGHGGCGQRFSNHGFRPFSGRGAHLLAAHGFHL